MSAGTIAATAIAVLIVGALIAAASLAARRRRLRQRFGPEYDRVVEGSDSRLRAEAELASREKRVRHLDIRPLDPAMRTACQIRWTAVQQQFVDTPAESVAGAQALITAVMAGRGYPTDDAGQIIEDLSVDHAATIGRLRTAQDISARAAGGTASTEDLRQAMIHYRALFEDLLGKPAEVPRESAEPVAPVPADPVPADPVPADVSPSGSEVNEDDVTRYDAPERAARAVAPGLDAGQEMIVSDARLAAPGPDDPGPGQPDAAGPGRDDEPEPAVASRLPWRR
jgi:hypothetical protein